MSVGNAAVSGSALCSRLETGGRSRSWGPGPSPGWGLARLGPRPLPPVAIPAPDLKQTVLWNKTRNHRLSENERGSTLVMCVAQLVVWAGWWYLHYDDCVSRLRPRSGSGSGHPKAVVVAPAPAPVSGEWWVVVADIVEIRQWPGQHPQWARWPGHTVSQYYS